MAPTDFAGLRRGDYEVSITNPDEAMYNFARTSQDVALGLGQAQDDISFAGTQVLMSSISGQVTVEGEALAGVTVTLGGDGDDTRTTGDDGLYAFLNLGSGTYTVSMANPDDAAYIFDTEPVEVTLGNTDEQTHNFGGTHTREASVSGMLFVDEGTKNDLHDEGEYPLAAEGVKVTLVGPTLLMRREAETDSTGAFAFGELRQGSYQLMLTSPDAAVMDDFGYGGDASYDIEVGVGADGGATQNLPFDITHQTVNFTVNLKSGDATGAALPGATVTLYSDLAGELKIADETTDDAGMAPIKFAREGTTGNQVYATVAAPAGSYHASGATQAVTWMSQHRRTDASNAGDIVNTMVDFSFSGATITTDMGGGKALGGWAVEVTSGDDDEAVDGAPTALGADGSAKFSETVTSVPKTYKIAVADDQANDSTGDGGEKYASNTLSHTHNGLSLPATTAAGMLEVSYITQTLKVYVHQENDQVMGYTGNVLGGDVRMSGRLEVELRHLDGSGRSRSFAPTDSIKPTESGGVWTFSNVPAASNVVATAEEYATLGEDEDGDDIINNAKLLKDNGHSDEVAAYTDAETNGIMGGAFGAQGGFNHTVELCPLMSGEGNQRHGDCGTFAFVNTYAVDGQAWKNVVSKSGDDFRYDADDNVVISTSGHAGVTVSMDPVDGENLAGDQDDFAAKTARVKAFDFDHMASGVYKVTVTPGWIAKRGPATDPTDDLEERLAPLDSALNIDVTPTTGYIYGTVEDGANRRLADVTVHVNGETDVTDSNGRYVVEGFGATNGCGTSNAKNVICVTDRRGRKRRDGGPHLVCGELAEADEHHDPRRGRGHLDQRFRHAFQRRRRVGGVEIKVPGLLNANAKSRTTLTKPDIYRTGSNGSYTVRIRATGNTVDLVADKDGMFFTPDLHTVSAVAGANISGINFTAFDNGTIHGRVVDGDDDPISGVLVTASQVGGTATDTMTTATTGTYSLSVRYGSYNVTATRDGYDFTADNGSVEGINVPNDGKAIDDIVGKAAENNAYLSALTLSGIAFPTKANPFTSADTRYSAEVSNAVASTTVRATPAVSGNDVDIYPDDTDGIKSNGHQVALELGETDIEIEVTAADGETKKMYIFTVDRRDPSTVISGTVTDAIRDPDTGELVGIGGVVITVGGKAPLNATGAAGKETLKTKGDGTYEAHVESTGGTAMVSVAKTGYTFTDDREVSLQPNSNVTGVDFTGSTYATITGRAVDSDGGGLEGVKVTGTSTGGGEPGIGTTDRRGNFSFRVASGTVTVTATKGGYDFPTQTIFVGAGETRSLGDIEATGTAEAVNIKATRDVGEDADSLTYNNTVSVTWKAGSGGVATSYQVQTKVGTGEWAPAGQPMDSTAYAAADSGDVDISNAPEGAFSLRVVATKGDPAVTYESGAITVAAVDPSVSDVKASRNIDAEPDELDVTWDAVGNTDSDWRVLVRFGDEKEWYIAEGTGVGGSWTGENNAADDLVAVAVDADGNAEDSKTADDVDAWTVLWNGALEFRVDYRQGETRPVAGTTTNETEPNPWTPGPTDSVTAKTP